MMSQRLAELRAAAEKEFADRQKNQPTVQGDPFGVWDEEETPTPASEAQPIEPTPEPTPEAQPVAEPTPEPEPAPDAQKTSKKNVYSRVIDLGDGSPPQVFRAATKDELIEKIALAQANATRRIKELKGQLKTRVEPDKATPTKTFEPRTLTADEELELGQEIQTNPSDAIRKALKAVIGAEPEEIREAVAASRHLKQVEEIRRVGQEFIAAHPEYPITTANEAAMGRYIQQNGLAWTVKNLEIAFQELSEAGLVKPASAANPVITVEDEVDEEPVLGTETPAVPTPVTPASAAPVVRNTPMQPTSPRVVEEPRRKKPVVGVSTTQSVATESVNETQREVSVEDLLKLPASERRRIVLQAAGNAA
jgi:hypothetical protein